MFWGGLNGDPFYSDEDDYAGYSRYSRYSSRKDFTRDPLFYFSYVPKLIIEKETAKAFLLKLEDLTFWMPKRLVRFKNNNFYIHTDIGLNQIFKKSLVEYQNNIRKK